MPALHTRLDGKGPVRFQSHFLFSTLVIIITKDTLPGAIVFHSGGVDVQQHRNIYFFKIVVGFKILSSV